MGIDFYYFKSEAGKGKYYDYDFSDRVISSKIDYTPHYHEYFEMDLYLYGKGKIFINEKQYELKRGTLTIVRPNELHALELHEDAREIHLSFTNAAVKDPQMFYVLHNLNEFYVNLDEECINYLMTLIDKLKSCFDNDFAYKTVYMSHIFDTIIMEFIIKVSADNNRSNDGNEMPAKMYTAINYIRANFLNENLTLENVAEYCGYTKNYFSEMFHRHMGGTYKSYVINLRLEYAAMLMISSDLSVTEISYMAGYNSMSSFQRAFKEKYKMSPGKYVKQKNRHP